MCGFGILHDITVVVSSQSQERVGGNLLDVHRKSESCPLGAKSFPNKEPIV